MKTTILVALLVAALAAPSGAVTGTATPPAARVDPAALAAATALVQQLDVGGMVVRMMQRPLPAMRSGVALRSQLAAQPGFVAAYNANKARFDAALAKAGAIQAEVAEKVIRDNAGQIAPAAAQAYARNFSAAELKALGDFYRSPLGQALKQRGPRVDAEITMATGRLMGAKMATAMQANGKRIESALAPLSNRPATPAPPKP